MRSSLDSSLEHAKRRVSGKTTAPVWAVLFESLIRGTTWAVVLFLIFILGKIVYEGGPRVAGIDTRAAMQVKTENVDQVTNVSRERALILDTAEKSPNNVLQTTLSDEVRSRLREREGLLVTREDGFFFVRNWKTASVDGKLYTNSGENLTVSEFREVRIDDGRIIVTPYERTPDMSFLAEGPKQRMESGGIFPALFGTVFVVLFMILMALPIGVLGAVYMVEYSSGGIFTRVIRAAVNNLAGVPSIVFGLFGLGFFVLFIGRNLDYYAYDIPRTDAERQAYQARTAPIREEARLLAVSEANEEGLEGSEREAYIRERQEAAAPSADRKVFGQGAMFWAAATLAILVLPVIIVSTEEALRSVPASLREASYGLGATKWQMIRTVVLPEARTGILTGAILSLARGAGELAPILFVGVTFFAPSLPLTEPVNFGLFEVPVVNPFMEFMHLNYHIFTMATQHPDPVGTRPIQFGTTLVLVAMTFLMNLGAIILRRRYTR